MENIKAVITFALSVFLSFSSVGIMIWKFEPLQRGLIIIISSAIEKAFEPFMTEQVKTSQEIIKIKNDQSVLTQRVNDIEKDIEHRDKMYNKRFETKRELIEHIEEKEAADMSSINTHVKAIDRKLNILLEKNIKGVE